MSHILGVHWIPIHGRDGDLDYMRRLQPSSVKIIDPDVMHIHRVHEAAPNALIVLREHSLSEQHDDVRRDPEGTGVRHARRWREKLDEYQAQASQRGLRLPPAHQMLVLGVNEPQVWSMLGETVRYNVAWLDECSRLGIRAGALNLSVGWPANKGPDTPADWTPYAPIEPAIRRGNHTLLLHEYHDQRGPAFNWRWWCGRFLWCPWDVPIIIGECGFDLGVATGNFETHKRGWRAWLTPAQYADALLAYAELCAKDGRIQSIEPFTTDGAREWQSFDTEAAHAAILARQWPEPGVPRTSPIRTMYVNAPGDGLTVREGPGLHRARVGGLVHGAQVTVYEVTGGEQPWARVDGGWVAYWLLSSSPPQPVVGPGPVEPTPPPPTPPQSTGIIDPLAGQAIIQIESGGQGFGPGNRLLIRFENHLFNRQTGNAFTRFFQHGDPPWTGHVWREKEGEVWLTLHTGNQNSEWDAFMFASTLNRNAALQSISMGAPQILGSNHRRIGYASAEAMFRAFGDRQYGMAAQMLGFVNFFLSDARLFEAMRNKDFLTVATIYNGPGQAAHYANLMRQAYERLK